MMMRGLIGQDDVDEFKNRLELEVKLIKEERHKKYTKGPFIVFEVQGQTKINLTQPARDFGSFAITIDAVDKETIKEKHQKLINQYLTSLFLVAEGGFQIDKVFEGFYLTDGDKIYYSYTLTTGSASGIVVKAFTDEATKKIKEYLLALNKSTDFEKIYRLLIQASAEQSDRLRSFIFAWTALEIFFNKVFKYYEKKFLDKYTIDGLPMLAQDFLKDLEM